MLILALLLIASIAVIYVGYPALIFAVAHVAGRPRAGTPPAEPPSVVLLVPVYNERAVIEEKLRNFLALEYPKGRLRAVVLSDGSNDGTPEQARAFVAGLPPEDRARITIVESAERRGKTRMLSDHVPKLDSDLVVFTDANAVFRPDAIRALAAEFDDPEVGLACGRLRYVRSGYSFMTDEELYWRYEDWIKRWEGQAGRLLVANGSIYALRRELFQPMPAAVADDFVLPLLTAAAGKRLRYVDGAVAEELLPLKGIENFRAKARIVTRGASAIRIYWREILGSGAFRIAQYVLRKVGRWLVGIALAGLLVVSFLGATNPILAALLGAQVAFYLLGFAAYLLSPYGDVPSLLRLPFYFLLVNAAALRGLWDFARGVRRATWEKSESTRRGRAAGAPEVRPREVRRPTAALQGVVVLLLSLAGALSIEAGLRATYLVREAIRAVRGAVPPRGYLYEFEVADPVHPGNWLLRPGLSMTVAEILAHSQRHRPEGPDPRLVAEAARRRLAPGDVALRINGAGFKGPDLAAPRAAPRVLAVGDSCTFGSLIDAASYPRVLERTLAESGAPAEVVNAGVGMYLPENVLARIDELTALAPDTVVVYLGCNAMYTAHALESRFGSSYALRAVNALAADWRNRAKDPLELTLGALRARRRYEPEAPDVERARRAEPRFVPRIGEVIRRFRETRASVYVVTIPSLFVPERPPTDAELAIGVLPEFTDNTAVFAGAVSGLNDALRRIAAGEGATVVDVDRWGRTALEPRAESFGGALNLSPEGERRVGRYVAEELAPRLREIASGARP